MKTRTMIITLVACLAAILLVGAILVGVGVRSLFKEGVSLGPDKEFGDQHLKTTVAMLELYHVRYGRYPDRLEDITFMGGWDKAVIPSVTYVPSDDRQHYYVEVERGWLGKPQLDYPEAFWRNTGYDPGLKKKNIQAAP
jgi:hypothetical protein